MIPLTNGPWGLLCLGIDNRHNEGYAGLRTDDEGLLSWAMWQPDRLVALQADTDGEMTLSPRECAVIELHLNYRTEPNGWIKAELIPPTLWPAEHLVPLAGYSFEECAPLRGNSLSAVV